MVSGCLKVNCGGDPGRGLVVGYDYAWPSKEAAKRLESGGSQLDADRRRQSDETSARDPDTLVIIRTVSNHSDHYHNEGDKSVGHGCHRREIHEGPQRC